MAPFQIELKHKGVNKKNVTFSHLMSAFLLIIMGAVAFVMVSLLGLTAAKSNIEIGVKVVSVCYITLGLIILYITISHNKKIIQEKNSQRLRWVEIGLLLPIAAFCIYKQWYVPAAYSAIGLLGILYASYYEKNAGKAQLVVVDDKGVHLPKQKTPFLPWEKVQRLILRHQILTVEAIGNKLHQLDTTADAMAQSSALEQYAAEHIALHKKLIPNDW